MKAYVIKNKEGKYCQITFNGCITFVSELCSAYIYHSKQGAEGIIKGHKHQLEDCQVVEITIAEVDNSKKEYNETSKYVDMLNKEIYELQNENLKQQLTEKDKEIEELKDKLKRTENAHHQEVKEHLEYYNADQKYLHHQVCEEIMNYLRNNGFKYTSLVSYNLVKQALDQIEKGESGKK